MIIAYFIMLTQLFVWSIPFWGLYIIVSIIDKIKEKKEYDRFT